MLQDPESGMFKQGEVVASYSKHSKEQQPAAAVSTAPPPAAAPVNNTEKLYVGHLPYNVSKRDLDDLFGRYGPIVSIEIKHGGYAFIQFEQLQDAQQAAKELDNFLFDDRRITVEFSNKKGTAGTSCLVCGQEGHWARDCPESKEKGLDVKSGKCFKCGGFGHLARFCRGEGTPAEEGGRGYPSRSRYPPPPPPRGREYRDYPYRRRSPSPRGYRGYDSYYRGDRYGDRYRDYPPPRDYYRYDDRYGAPPARYDHYQDREAGYHGDQAGYKDHREIPGREYPQHDMPPPPPSTTGREPGYGAYDEYEYDRNGPGNAPVEGAANGYSQRR